MPLPRFVDYSLRFIAPISLGLAIYYHYQSVQERTPTYYVSPTRARLVEMSVPKPPQLQVLYKGKELNANIAALRVYFWNGGRLPIKTEDVLTPVSIELDPGCDIIDARILKVSRVVTKFARGDVSEAAKNSLPLSFSILERNDGAAIQIIYSGKADTTVSLRGTVVGAEAPRPLAPDEKTFEAETRTKLLRAEWTMGWIFYMLGAFVLGWWMEPWISLSRILGLRHADPRPAPRRSAIRVVSGLLAVALTLLGWTLSTRATGHMSPSVPDSIWLKE